MSHIEFELTPLPEQEFQTLQDRATDAQRIGRAYQTKSPELYQRGEEAIRLLYDLAFLRHPPQIEDRLYQQAMLIGCNLLQRQLAQRLQAVLDS